MGIGVGDAARLCRGMDSGSEAGMIRLGRTGSPRGEGGVGTGPYCGRTVTFMAPVDLSRAVSKASVTELRGYWWVCMKPTSEE